MVTMGKKSVYLHQTLTNNPFIYSRIYFRGFIRAETISYDDLVTCGSEKAAKEKGLLRSEGKEYIVQEGDVVHFRFNVSK